MNAPRFDISNLVARAKKGEVRGRELQGIAHILSNGTGGSDTYRLLYVIVRSGARKYEGLVSDYLYYREDPMVARLALQALCVFWGLGHKYLNVMEDFLRGVDWDYLGDVQGVAITAAGEYLRDHNSYPLLAELFRLAQDGDDSVRQRIAIEALARAVGETMEASLQTGSSSGDRECWMADVLARCALRIANEIRSTDI